MEIFIPLSGTGVEADPQALMDDLLAFFNEKVAAGEIYGRGAIPRIAHARLRVFGRLLDSADDLIVSGDYACAAQVLERALLRSDGRRRPSDFVAGEAVDELDDKIEQLIEVLETS